MRYFFLTLLIVGLAGCAHNRIRLVKSNSDRIVVAEKEKSSGQPDQSRPEIAKAIPQQEETTVATAATSDDILPETSPDPIKKPTFAEENPADTIKMTTSEYQLMVAEDAEKDARKSRDFFIASLLILIIPYISLFSIVPFIIGLLKLNRSNNSRYITSEGERQARISTILRNIYIVLISLVALAILAMVIIFVL